MGGDDSNWVLRRDDQVGCVPFATVDYLEAVTTRSSRLHQ